MPRARQFAVRVAVTVVMLLLLLEVLSHTVFVAFLASGVSSANTRLPQGPCTMSVMSTAPFVATAECRNWQLGRIYEAEIRIDGPGGVQHWSVASLMGETWSIRTWTSPAVHVEYPGDYTVALILDGQVAVETEFTIYTNRAPGSENP